MQLTTFVRAWNKGTQTWLALYVMKRLPSLHFCHTLCSYVGKRLPETMGPQLKKVIVMCTSALWHGLYPGDAACLPAAVATCSHSVIFRTPHPKLPHVIFHAPLPPLQATTALFFSLPSGAKPKRSSSPPSRLCQRCRPSRSCDVSAL